MNRRTSLQSLGLITSHALFPSILAGFVTACRKGEAAAAEGQALFFSAEEMGLLAQVIDLILPATETKSASQVGTHHFLDEVFAKCLEPEQQTLIKEGMIRLKVIMAEVEDPASALAGIDRRAFSGEEDAAYFRLIKQYTLIGFFTSQEGIERAARYEKFPGDFQGEVPADEQTLIQAKTNLHYYL